MKYVKSVVDAFLENPTKEGEKTADIIEAAIKKALASVLSGDAEYITRYIYRQYSKTFNTPLHEAYNLSFDFVLREYIEHKIENELQLASNLTDKLEYINKYIMLLNPEEEEEAIEEYVEFVKKNFVNKKDK